METKPLLSICIPTYNRSGLLKETLDSLVVQPEFACGRVEIVISDNASTDGTQALCEEYLQKYPGLRYFRNAENVRDRNFPLALSRGTGLLRRLNNDTFRHYGGSLAFMCEKTEKYMDSKPVLFFSNGYCPGGKDETVSFSDLCVRAGYWATWIAAFTIWEDDCEGLAEDMSGTELNLWQVKKLYELGSSKNSCVVIDDKIGEVMEVEKKNISYGMHRVFYTNFLSLLRPYVGPHITELQYEQIRKDLLWFFLGFIVQWEIGTDSMEYSPEENLKELVFGEYRDAPYFKEFEKEYKREIASIRLRQKIKRLIGMR